MDIKQLTYFCAIVEEGTVIGAARKLHMTQPPLTTQIQQLETELGCELFKRDGRRIILNETGKCFYKKAKNILGLCDATVNEMRDYTLGTSGTLRIGIVSSVQDTMFLNWISSFREMYPNISYDIYNKNTYNLLEMLNNGLIDIALVRTPFTTEDYDITILKKEVMIAVGSPEFFPKEVADKIPLCNLAKAPLILYRRWKDVITSHFEEIGYTPNIICLNDNAQMTMSLIKRNLGLGIVPESALTGHNTNGLITKEITDPVLSTEIALVCHNKNSLPNAAKLFINHLAKETEF